MGFALAKSITGSVHELFVGTEHVRRGEFSHRIRIRTRDQLGELGESFNAMTSSVKDALQQAAEKKRLEEELRIARDIQMSLLPRDMITIPGLAVTAVCRPAREVGGDYYDFIRLGERRLGVLVADVSGKGTSAAFYMARAQGGGAVAQPDLSLAEGSADRGQSNYRGTHGQQELHHDDVRGGSTWTRRP